MKTNSSWINENSLYYDHHHKITNQEVKCCPVLQLRDTVTSTYMHELGSPVHNLKCLLRSRRKHIESEPNVVVVVVILTVVVVIVVTVMIVVVTVVIVFVIVVIIISVVIIVVVLLLLFLLVL